jgi:hypothetical protein
MISIEPSYLAKLRRAEHHLGELTKAVAEYANTHPYTFEILGDRTGRLTFTAYPENTEIPIIAADVIYNMRSALDHLIAKLVPANRERSVYFPILFDGVWDDPVDGENERTTRDRERWATYVKGVHPQAVEIIKGMQPSPDPSASDPTVNFLIALNRMAVRDRHTRLPLTASTGWADSSGALHHDGLMTGLPGGIVEARIHGQTVVAVQIGGDLGHLRLPDSLAMGVRVCRERIVAPLIPFVRA